MLIYSCKKDEPFTTHTAATSPQIWHIDTSMIHYEFKPGSYWVYKNDTTAALDSIVVDSVSNGLDIMYLSGVSQTTFEYYTMNMHSFGTSQYYYDYLFSNFFIRSGHLWSDFDVTGQPTLETNCDTGTVFYDAKMVAKYTSLILNGNNFTNIVESKVTAAHQNQQEFTNDTYFFYSPSAGLIKKEIDLGGGNIQSWSILRWHIIR